MRHHIPSRAATGDIRGPNSSPLRSSEENIAGTNMNFQPGFMKPAWFYHCYDKQAFGISEDFVCKKIF
jgi:hypothetical protein